MDGYFKFYADPNEQVYDQHGEVHVVMCGLDYTCDTQSWAGQNPLDTKAGFDYVLDLVQYCPSKVTLPLWNGQCTKDGVLGAIQSVGSMTGPNDFFIFYYTGHGSTLSQDDRFEAEHEDQALCLVDEHGNADIGNGDASFRTDNWLRDDDLAQCLLDSVHPEAFIIVLVDACHSGTICDFSTNPKWTNERRKAISITGCMDSQTSAGTGAGGHYTHAAFRALQVLNEQKAGEWYGVSDFYNTTLQQYMIHKDPNHTQQITIHGCTIRPHECVWPLKPASSYVAPANRA